MPVSSAIDQRGVATITIDNTARLNTLNRPLMRELIAAADALSHHSTLRALVLRGAGDRAFIGGADIRDMAALDATSAGEFISLVHQTCDVFRRLPVPVIASLQGYTLGAGLEIAAACDMRIAADNARFGMPEVRVGIPSVVEAALLPRLIGWGRTRRILLTGEIIDAQRAFAWGLVEEITPPAGLDDAIDHVLTAILSAGAQALRLQKELIAAWEDLPVSTAIARGVDSFVAAWNTDEPTRMMQAFLQRKRAPLSATPGAATPPRSSPPVAGSAGG
ncbi:MAG TPA: enoyl-CoA hydratase [Acetobacteraceae bacterium]